ncbi:MAG: c-type cytochrome [Vicinamibacterales bacterium]
MKLRLAFLIVAGFWTMTVAGSSIQVEQATSVWDGVFTAEQAKRGEAAYTEACSSCHGADMAGDGFAPALAGSDFAGNWNDLSVGDLFERIRISMPPTGPSAVPPQGKVDIVAHILDFNKYPTGSAELEPKTEVLKQIKIELKK